MATKKKVLIACEFSGVVREAFKRMGHDAWSCDLLDTEIPGQHIVGDALEVLGCDAWDLVIAHPPCQFLTNAGVRWLYGMHGGSTQIDPVRWADMEAGAAFFRAFFERTDCPLAVENPIMHKYAREAIGDPADLCQLRQTVQPYHFGHPESKATTLWLRDLPALTQTKNVYAEYKSLPASQGQRVWLASPGPDRWKLRSRTFPAIAEAMARQWGGWVTGTSVSLSVSTSTIS